MLLPPFFKTIIYETNQRGWQDAHVAAPTGDVGRLLQFNMYPSLIRISILAIGQ